MIKNLYINRISIPILLILLFLIGCAYQKDLTTTVLEPIEITHLPSTPAAKSLYPNSRTNRFVEGQIDLSSSAAFDIPLSGEPQRVFGTNYEDGTLWVVALETGKLQAFYMNKNNEIFEIAIEQDQPIFSPFEAISSFSPIVVLDTTIPDRSMHAAAILLGPDQYAYINENGEIAISKDSNLTVFNVSVLPDARILKDENNHLLFLSTPTKSYDHGVLGDSIEAQSVTFFNPFDGSSPVNIIELDEGKVIEGIAPIWANISGDENKEIIITTSKYGEGATIEVYDHAGNYLASSYSIGQSYRWRHQLMVAPFGPNGEIEIASVLTPHLGKVVEYFRLEKDELILTASIQGYTTHQIGSRNMDMALAGNFDNDEKIELLIPTSDFTRLAILERGTDEVQEEFKLPIGGEITTNISFITQGNMILGLGVGNDNHMLRIWISGN